ncbi:MAG TPA: Sir2 family NAD-dependent protein deacetylase, partial [Saprospiraceae bacterium]|nr:Sir2 family NAD-dependent protein deacetylase [Saprospiraceae bacterium]
MTKRRKMSKVVILTGAGISAESGIRTFRDAGGLWEGYKIEEVATPEAWERNPQVVLDFYNERRKQLHSVSPNAAHAAIARLDPHFDTVVITQNVDNLHERAGSTHIIHLHGELLKARSERYEHLIYDWPGDITLGDQCERGMQLRPHIVWFGEMVPMLEPAVQEILNADIILVVGSSMQVYPAAGLVAYAPMHAMIYYIDPKPTINYELSRRANLEVI